jgi:hypothetical protein
VTTAGRRLLVLVLALFSVGIGCGRVERTLESSETNPVPAESGSVQGGEPLAPHQSRSRPPPAMPSSELMLTILTEPRRPRPRPLSMLEMAELRTSTVAVSALAYGPMTCPERLESCGRFWPPYVADLSRSGLLDLPLPALLRPLDGQAQTEVLVGMPGVEERIIEAFSVAE